MAAQSEPNAAAREDRPAWPLRTLKGPVSFSPERTRLLWFALAAVALLPIVTAPKDWNDFSAFWSAGGTVGTASLVDSHLHAAWQVAHGLPADAWRYPPAFAFVYWPLSLLPIGLGFALNSVAMAALIATAGWLLARVFSFRPSFGVWLAFAWTPLIAALDMGQNAPLSVVLALWAIDALRRDSRIEVGVAVGLLMYKPTLGLPLLGFVLLRGCWRSVSVASLIVAGGYLLSVVAAAGDWGWPVAWWNGMQALAAHDISFNADKAISVPSLLSRISSLPSWVPYAGGGLVVLASLRGLIRAPMVEAASAACLVGLVAGPRVWSYETGLILPILGWVVAGGLSEPWRTRSILLSTVVAILWMVSPVTSFSGVAAVVGVATVLWLRRWPPLRWPRTAGAADLRTETATSPVSGSGQN